MFYIPYRSLLAASSPSLVLLRNQLCSSRHGFWPSGGPRCRAFGTAFPRGTIQRAVAFAGGALVLLGLAGDLQDFKEYAEMLRGIRSEPSHKKLNVKHDDLPQETISDAEREKLVALSRQDPLAEISEQEKDALWKLRKHCLSIPDILPRFLDAVKWNSRDDLTDLYALLEVIIIPT